MLLCAAADHNVYGVKMPPTSPLRAYTGEVQAVECGLQELATFLSYFQDMMVLCCALIGVIVNSGL